MFWSWFTTPNPEFSLTHLMEIEQMRRDHKRLKEEFWLLHSAHSRLLNYLGLIDIEQSPQRLMKAKDLYNGSK